MENNGKNTPSCTTNIFPFLPAHDLWVAQDALHWHANANPTAPFSLEPSGPETVLKDNRARQ